MPSAQRNQAPQSRGSAERTTRDNPARTTRDNPARTTQGKPAGTGLVIAGALALALAFGGSFAFVQYARSDAESTAARLAGEPKASPPFSVSEKEVEFIVEELVPPTYSVTLTFTGDCIIGTDEAFYYPMSFPAYYDSYGPDYFLQNMRGFFEEDDLTVINMEGVFTHQTTREPKEFAFKGPPEYVDILAGSSVEAAHLANNHSADYGHQSYLDTIYVLETAGILSFGYERVQLIELNGVRVGLVGAYSLVTEWQASNQISEGIAQLKREGAQVIIVVMHWGEEKLYEPLPSQIRLAHQAIDEGADLVVGHHPHVMQGQETYRGKQIIYSLGNFCYGGNTYPFDMDAILFRQTFTLEEGFVASYDDYRVIPISVSSELGYNDYCPRILEGDEAARVLRKFDSLRID